MAQCTSRFPVLLISSQTCSLWNLLVAVETVMLCVGGTAQESSGEAVRTLEAWNGMVD